MSKMRIGLDGHRPPVLATVRALGATALISANNLWDRRRSRFRGIEFLDGLDVALDSGGFVAMRQHGRFLFSVREYLALVARLRPTWWASMDFCCEEDCPIGDATTWDRQVATATLFGTLWRLAPAHGIARPMPVLQGWQPADYFRCAGMLWQEVHWKLWPTLIGIGSVCRRQINGRDGILRVVDALHHALPAHFRFHLFGVKGDALAALAGHPRLGSLDSSAYDRANRHDHARTGQPRTNAHRAEALRQWYVRQIDRAYPAVDLFGMPC